MPWWNEGAEPDADMWATDNESSEQIIELYRRVRARADARIADLPLARRRGGSIS